MRTVTMALEGVSDLVFSRFTGTDVPRIEKEGPDDYDKRVWRDKAHIDGSGVYIPAVMIKRAVITAAKRRGTKIAGKGNATYGKRMDSALIPTDPAPLGISRDDLRMIAIHCNADGVRGGGKRVMRHFPSVQAPWKTKVTMAVVDDAIPVSEIEASAREAGILIGIGSFRPENGNANGRFKVTSFAWGTFSV
jgi:hypothetical protein